jgi:hypothetical protein
VSKSEALCIFLHAIFRSVLHIYVFTRRQKKIFPPTFLVLKYLRTFDFAYEEPEQTALNQTMPSQSDMGKQRENSTGLKLNKTAFFLGLCPSANFLNKYVLSENGSVAIFRQRNT